MFSQWASQACFCLFLASTVATFPSTVCQGCRGIDEAIARAGVPVDFWESCAPLGIYSGPACRKVHTSHLVSVSSLCVHFRAGQTETQRGCG